MHRHILAFSLIVFAFGVAINLWAILSAQHAVSLHDDGEMADRMGHIVAEMGVAQTRQMFGGLMMLIGFFSGVIGLVWSLYQKPTMKANEI